jgi:hypothetical protein
MKRGQKEESIIDEGTECDIQDWEGILKAGATDGEHERMKFRCTEQDERAEIGE